MRKLPSWHRQPYLCQESGAGGKPALHLVAAVCQQAALSDQTASSQSGQQLQLPDFQPAGCKCGWSKLQEQQSLYYKRLKQQGLQHIFSTCTASAVRLRVVASEYNASSTGVPRWPDMANPVGPLRPARSCSVCQTTRRSAEPLITDGDLDRCAQTVSLLSELKGSLPWAVTEG